MIADFYEVTPDLQRCKRATAQLYHCQGANNQAIAVLNGLPRPGAPGGICRSDGTVHELDPECIKAITGRDYVFAPMAARPQRFYWRWT
jgi:hypothetical protein